MTPHGPLTHPLVLPLEAPHGDTAITVCNPMAMLYEACLRCDGFAHVFRTAHEANPSSPDGPWHIILYNDEIGHNPFASGEDERKCHGVYWTLLELGEAAIHSENAWFVVAAVRSSLVKHLSGNISHLDKLLLKRLFFDSEGGDEFRTGIELTFKDDHHLQFFATFKCFVGDGDALKHVLDWKGSGGFKMCFCCDVVDHTSPNQAGYTPCTCLDASKIVRTSNEFVFAVFDELADLHAQAAAHVKGAKASITKLSKHYGWNFNEDNLFLDADLQQMGVKPVTSCMYDWFHIYVVSGIWNYELFYLLMYLRKLDKNIFGKHGRLRPLVDLPEGQW